LCNFIIYVYIDECVTCVYNVIILIMCTHERVHTSSQTQYDRLTTRRKWRLYLVFTIACPENVRKHYLHVHVQTIDRDSDISILTHIHHIYRYIIITRQDHTHDTRGKPHTHTHVLHYADIIFWHYISTDMSHTHIIKYIYNNYNNSNKISLRRRHSLF